jgi:hypothetical protein
MNQMFDQSLYLWKADTNKNDSTQNKLHRIYSSKSIMAWSELLKDAVCTKLDINDSDEKERVFYRDFMDLDFSKIGNILSRLFNWQMWSTPISSEIDTIIAGNKQIVKDWFKKKGLSVSYLMGASE